MSKLVIFSLLALFLTGCFDGSVEAKLVKEVELNSTTKAPQIRKFSPKKELESTKKEQELKAKFYQIFGDGAKIAPNGKDMLLVFGQPKDPYTKKFQEDVVNDTNLSNKISKEFSPYYIDATKVKMHKFWHSGKLMDVDTKTLISIYGIDSTPTIIFLDKDGKSILRVPGYMPPKQFIVTIDFIKDGNFTDKDRKDGKIYKKLKDYYLLHKIKVKAKR